MALIVAILRIQQRIGIGGNVNAVFAGELSLRPCDRILRMPPGATSVRDRREGRRRDATPRHTARG